MIVEEPKDWKDLQDKVNFILNGVGLNSSKEKQMDTPRGSVEIDVFAIDPLSVDEIKYIVECKNWNNKIPQTVIHSFMTVMNETGGNIGYIISKKGFQEGAISYAKNTNIKLFSFDEFQNHYFKKWYRKYFSLEISQNAKSLISFVEPINSLRDKYYEDLDDYNKEQFERLVKKYSSFADLLLAISLSSENHTNIFFKKEQNELTIDNIKNITFNSLKINLQSSNYLDILNELLNIIKNSTQDFILLFGKNIFIK